MTTKVTITCQEDSHWDLKVITQHKVFDNEAKKMTDKWEDHPHIKPIVLGPGQSTEHLYVYDSRRYIVEEVVRG